MTTLIGTNPDQVPVNSMLGGMAYQDPESISVKDLNSSGTANINSLVSPTASITNLSYSGTLTGGTGVINIGSSQIYKDALGNVGVGVIPNAIVSGVKAVQIGSLTTVAYNPTKGASTFINNAYQDTASTYKYQFTGYATRYEHYDGNHVWLNAPSGTAGTAATFVEYMRLDDSGNQINSGTGATKLQEGTTAQRPASPQEGMIRKNSTTSELEGYIQSQYTDLLTKLSPSGRKNYLTNGNFMYNYPAKIPGTVSLNPDSPAETRIDVCWKARSERITGASSGTASYSFSTDSSSLPSEPGTRCKLNVSCNSTEHVAHTIFTRIEGKNLVGGEVMTVSFWHKSSTGDSISVSVRSPSTEDTWPNYVSGDEVMSYTIVAGSVSWVKRSLTFTNPNGNTKGLQVDISCITTALSDTYSFTGFQLERGYTASSLEYLTQKQIQDDCHRYYYPVTGAVGNSSGGGFVFTVQLPTQMRTISSGNVTKGSGYYAHDGTSSTGLIIPTSTTFLSSYPYHSLTALIAGGTAISAGSVRQLYGSIAVINCEL